MPPPDATVVRRRQNAWGEGAQLRRDIVSAARHLLEEAGTESAVSMRGVARMVGITAPSIYLHFRDRQALVAAVIDVVYDESLRAQDEAVGALSATASPRERLQAGIGAFVRFSRENPSSARALWTRPNPSEAPEARRAAEANQAATEQALAAACPGLHGQELRRREQVLWVAVYGLAVLLPHHPRFDWCETGELVEEILDNALRPPANR